MKRVTLNVFTSDGKEHEPYVFGAPKGQSFSKDGEQQIVALFMGHVQEQFPNNVFRVVRIGRGKFNVLPESVDHA